MASPETPIPRLPVDRRWLWVTRVAVLVPVVPVVVYLVVYSIPRWGNPCYDNTEPVAIFLFLAIIPYLLSIKGLWGKKLKKALAWAQMAGGFWAAAYLLIAFGACLLGEIKGCLLALVVGATQIALVVGAVKTYRSMEPEENDRKLLMRRLLWLLPYAAFVFLSLVAIPGLLRSRRLSAEATALSTLRTINMAEITYKETYGKGYSATLAALGPPAAGASPSASCADLVDERLAGGQKGGYSFMYLPGPTKAPDSVNSYSVSALPGNSACTNWPRFFTDQSGIVRWTREDRPATAQDPPLGEGNP